MKNQIVNIGIALVCLSLAACTTTNPTKATDVDTAKPSEIPQPAPTVAQKPPIKTSIFTYPFTPYVDGQDFSVVRGTFLWQDGCIYLKQGDEVSTAMFPSSLVKWDESSRTLTLKDEVFEMGEYIRTNGAYRPYFPNQGDPLEKQGDAKCLKPMISGLGTMDIFKVGKNKDTNK